MREFFRGWKRKVGCVTLVFACLFSAGWVRSKTVTDVFHLDSARLLSMDGSLLIEEGDFAFGLPRWTCSRWESLSETFRIVFEWEWHFLGLGKGAFGDDPPYWFVPYWSVVTPLTLLSAWLLLSKPRARKPTIEQQANA